MENPIPKFFVSGLKFVRQGSNLYVLWDTKCTCMCPAKRALYGDNDLALVFFLSPPSCFPNLMIHFLLTSY